MGLLFGVPFALTYFVGNPFPTKVPNMENVTAILQGRKGFDPKVLVNIAAVIGWFAWFQVAMATLSEVWYRAAGKAAETVAVFAPIQIGIGKLVTTTTLLVTSFTRTAMAATPPPLEATAYVVPDGGASHQAEPRQAPPERQIAGLASGDYKTQAGDTWWGIAEQTTGDGANWKAIRAANIDRRMADGTTITDATRIIQIGWTLAVPQTYPAVDDSPVHDSGSHEVDVDVDLTDGTVIVEKGDHLWSLAEEQLRESLGREPTINETTAHWLTFIEVNEGNLLPPHDPDLIYPGQILDQPAVTIDGVPGEPEAPVPDTGNGGSTGPGSQPLLPPTLPVEDVPTVGDLPAEPASPGTTIVDTGVVPPVSNPRPRPVVPTTEVPEVVSTPPSTEAEPEVVLVPQAVPQAPPTTATAKPVPAVDPPTTVGTAEVADETSNQDGSLLTSRRAGVLGGASALAFGVVLGLRRMRERRDQDRPPRHQRGTPPYAADEIVERLAYNTDEAGLEGLDIALRGLGRLLSDSDTPSPDIIGAATSPEHYSLLLNEASPAAPAPFVSVPDRKAWEISHTDLAELEDLAWNARAPLPTLLTLGTTPAHKTLHVHAERCKVIQISGEDQERLETLVSFATQLATSALADDMTIFACGFGAGVLGTWARLEQSDGLPDPEMFRRHIDLLTDLADASSLGAPIDGRISDLGGDSYDPVVVVHRATPGVIDPRLSELVALAEASAGGLTVITDSDDVPHLGWELQIDGELLHVAELDVSVVHQNLTVAQSTAVGAATQHVKVGGWEPIGEDNPAYIAPLVRLPDPDPDPQVLVVGDDTPEPDDLAEPVDIDLVEASIPEVQQLDIKVLGTIDLGIEKTWTRARVPEVIAFLALNPNGATNETIHSKLFGADAPFKRTTVNKLTSDARTSLGVSPGGHSYLSRTEEDPLGRYRLSYVSTDLERFNSHVTAARNARDSDQAVGHLTDALSLVRGRPFNTKTEWVWATVEQQILIKQIEDAAVTVAEFHLDSGRYADAIWATKQGLLAGSGNRALEKLHIEAALKFGDHAEVVALFKSISFDASDHPEDFDFDLDENPEFNDAYQRLRKEATS